FHLLRLTQLDHLLRQGVFFSRWAPDMAQGYGFPFFNFYAPLSYYLAEAVSLLAGNLNLGMRITFALGVYLAGLSAYRLSRDHFSRPAAIVTAVAYMYAPYFAYDILFRGNLAESVAWLFLPLSLWTMGRLARTGQNRWLVAAALSYAAVLLTHNVFALIFSPLLGLYGLVEIGDWRLEIKERRNLQSLISNLWSVILAILLGLGLTTFFWLPAMVERALVHSDRLLVPPIFVYWGNFVTLAEIFTPPQTVYTNLINPSPARALGLVPLLLALPALLIGWWRFKDSRRQQVIFFGVATAVYIFFMLSISEPIWANLPLIEYIQFPWRLMGPAALCLAVLVGASVDLLTHYALRIRVLVRSAYSVVASIYCIVLILGNLYWLDARYCPGLENPTIADMQEFERATLTIGTTAKGEYLPLTVEYMPETPAIEPFAPLPDTSTSSVTVSGSRTPKQFTATISASEPFTLTANTFAYPGWQAKIDGEKVDITPSEGTGLITIPVPAGDHDLTITFRETPLRLVADLVSLLSVVVLVLVASGRWQVGKEQQGGKVAERQGGSVAELMVLGFIGLGVFAVVVWILPRVGTIFQQAYVPPSGVAGFYSNGLNLLTYEIAAREMAADESLLVQSNWRA
ncbi:MAG: glycosyltransferase family 39 protein, partial [Anaerolineae bacterium]|nr:glycosyltransferase family 39 protein [Anaerolineae bacterium]